jgi:hypothetical protein
MTILVFGKRRCPMRMGCSTGMQSQQRWADPLPYGGAARIPTSAAEATRKHPEPRSTAVAPKLYRAMTNESSGSGGLKSRHPKLLIFPDEQAFASSVGRSQRICRPRAASGHAASASNSSVLSHAITLLPRLLCRSSVAACSLAFPATQT